MNVALVDFSEVQLQNMLQVGLWMVFFFLTLSKPKAQQQKYKKHNKQSVYLPLCDLQSLACPVSQRAHNLRQAARCNVSALSGI